MMNMRSDKSKYFRTIKSNIMLSSLFKSKEASGSQDPIIKRHERNLAKEQLRGRSLAARLLPKSGDSLESYIAPIRAEYQAMGAEFIPVMSSDAKDLAEAEKGNLVTKSEQLTNQVNQAREMERTLNLQRDTLLNTNYKSQNKKLLYAVVVILALGEALVTRPALSIFTENSNLVECLVLIMLTVFFIVLPHGIVITFRASEDSKYKTPIRIVALAVILFGLFVLANMRSIYLQQIGNTTMADVKATSTVPMKIWWFIGLNLFFLFASTLCVFMMGTSDENESHDRARDIDKRIEAARAEAARCERELQNMPDRIYASDRQWSQKQAERDAVRNRINSLFLQTANSFISENMLYRSDRPACLDELVKPLY
jgi:hypothetical protein